jgi:hypothetical protein
MKSAGLVILLVVVTISGGAAIQVSAETDHGELSSDQFQDPLDKCRLCHAEIYKQWNGSIHSQAKMDPYYLLLFRLAGQKTNGLTDIYCSRCHTPIGLVSGEIPPADGSNLSEIAKKGIQCDFCHSVSGSDGTGNARYIVTPDGTKRGPFADSRSSAHETEFSELHTRAEFCGMCHDVFHPTNGLVLEATYTEWKEGPYASQGTQCQDCHMTPGITQFQANPGKASGLGPQREHIWTHFVVGGNAFMTEYQGSNIHRDMAVDRLQRAAKITVTSNSSAKPGQNLTFAVKIENVGCGHYLPTGLTESRQMWLDITVTDGAGTQMYRSGALDEHGSPDAMIYHTVLGDAYGNPTEKVWEAESILSDHRIPPKGEVTEPFSLPLPAGVQTPIHITAILKYRSAPQECIDDLFGEGEVEVPIIEMTQHSITVSDEDQDMSGFQITILVIIGFIVLIFIHRRSKHE